jgi:hypothetical protein
VYQGCRKIIIPIQQQFSSPSSLYKLVKLGFTTVANIGDTTGAFMKQCDVTKFAANVVSYSCIV